jgi:hypothetical protein
MKHKTRSECGISRFVINFNVSNLVYIVCCFIPFFFFFFFTQNENRTRLNIKVTTKLKMKYWYQPEL